MFKIEITDIMKKTASKNRYEEITNGREYVLPTSKFWAGDNQFQNFIGNIGELIFEQFLLNNSIKYKKDILYLNHGDHFDFLINGKTFDVKTGHLKWSIDKLQPGYRFFIAEHQIKKKVYCYINIQLDPELKYAYITGFILGELVEKYPIVYTEAMQGPATAIPLYDLTYVEYFKGFLENGSVKEQIEEQNTLDTWM